MLMEELNRKVSNSLNYKYFLIAASVYVVWVFVFSFYNYQVSKKELLADLDARLELAARNYLNIVPADLHNKNMKKGDLTKEVDRELVLRSNEYARINHVYYLYSAIKVDNKIYFTMGNGTEKDMAELDGGGYYFYPYEEAQPHFFKSFEVTEPLFHDTTDHWGSFRSVVIPYVSKDGTKFVVGADITTGYIDELLKKELELTLIVSVLFLVFAAPILGVFISHTRRWAKSLEIQTHKTIANEEKLRSLVKLAVDAIITTDDKGIVTDFNDSAHKMFGYTEDEIVGANVNVIIANSIDNASNNFLSSFYKLGEGEETNNTQEFYAQRKNGEIFPIEISVTEVILNKKERIFSTIIRDLTEKKQKEKQLHNLVEKSEAANRAKSEFLHKMSHELRTPLHGIIAFSQLGFEKAETEKMQKYFDTISKSGGRLKTLLDDLLDLSKLEAGKMELSFTNQNVRAIIDDCIMEQQGLINQYHLNITVVENTSYFNAECDIGRLSQVILNLLNNAIKFAPENSTITIVISSVTQIEGNAVNALQISVADQGVGVPKESRERIFDKFSQTSTVNDKMTGTGLGLAISRELIKAHNGIIWCQESESGGAEFVFRIPVLSVSGENPIYAEAI